MQDRFETLISGTIAIAAMAMAIVFVHREFGGNARVQLIQHTPKPPEQIADWKEVLDAGVLVGDSAAPVKIVEFADFECPFCKRFELGLRDAKKQFGGKVALVFVHLPLKIHRFSLPAARAAQCAASQGKFAAFHDVIYDKQDSLGLKSWVSYAREAGIQDTDIFARCNERTVPIAQIVAGQAIGKKLNVHSTPTVIVNGWRFYAPPSDSMLAQIITAALAGDKPLEKLARQGQ